MATLVANFILGLHLVVVIVLIFGWVIHQIRCLWGATAFATVTTQIIFGGCPLTIIEIKLRQIGGADISAEFLTKGLWGYLFGYDIPMMVVAIITAGLFIFFYHLLRKTEKKRSLEYRSL